jgi:AmmeMemoRadiSam system protein B
MAAARVRPPAVAGTFYPAGPAELRRFVERALLAAAPESEPATPPPKAIVVPHAGYTYSGVVAATAYARLSGRHDINRVVVLGPAHRSLLAAVAAPSVDGFATPLGVVPVDIARREDLAGRGLVVVADEPHRREHSLEVQLPFLQVVLGDVPVLPLAVGRVPAGAVVVVLDDVWDDPATLVVVSTDLSHYHDHATASALDRETAAAVVAGRADAVTPDRACGATALRALVLAAGRHARRLELLDLRTSADTAGPADRVVGYGAFAVVSGDTGRR